MTFNTRSVVYILVGLMGAAAPLAVNSRPLTEQDKRILELMRELSTTDQKDVRKMQEIMLKIQVERGNSPTGRGELKLEDIEAEIAMRRRSIHEINLKAKEIQADPVLSQENKNKFLAKYHEKLTNENLGLLELAKKKQALRKTGSSKFANEGKKLHKKIDVNSSEPDRVYMLNKDLTQEVQIARKDSPRKKREPASWANPRDADVINQWGLPDLPVLTTEQEQKVGIR